MTGLTVYLRAGCLPAMRRQTRGQATLREQMTEARKLDTAIAGNLKEFGYGG